MIFIEGGKYVIRLEEKYGVKITFARDSDDSAADEGKNGRREVLKPDEVLIKGGKKGVAGAKAEILEAVEFEKEANVVSKFTVPTRAVARILGKGGVSINQIKDETGAQIDIDKPADAEGNGKDPTSLSVVRRRPSLLRRRQSWLSRLRCRMKLRRLCALSTRYTGPSSVLVARTCGIWLQRPVDLRTRDSRLVWYTCE